MRLDFRALQGRRLSWYVVLPLLGMVILLFTLMLTRNAAELRQMDQEEASLRVQLSTSQGNEQTLRSRLTTVSSSGTLTAEARAMSFVNPSEICFYIENAQDLDLYTRAEWDMLMQERRYGR